MRLSDLELRVRELRVMCHAASLLCGDLGIRRNRMWGRKLGAGAILLVTTEGWGQG